MNQARGYDDLTEETLHRFVLSHVGTTEAAPLRVALAAGVAELLDEGVRAGVAHAPVVAERLADIR